MKLLKPRHDIKVAYRRLGHSDLVVSVVGLGTWPIAGYFFGDVDERQAIKAIHAALDHGINLIDTAPSYGGGLAEELIGKALKSHNREKVVLATKVGTYLEDGIYTTILKPSSVRRQLEHSLKRMGVDEIDLYQIHWPDPDTPFEESVAELNKLRDEGKIRYLGVSSFSLPQLIRMRELTEIISVQPHYSLLKRDAETDILPYCRRHELGVLGFGTLAGGILAGKYHELPQFPQGDRRYTFYHFFYEPFWSKAQQLVEVLRLIAGQQHRTVAQVAINWSIRQPGITAALVGAKTPLQAVSDAAAGTWSLSEEDLVLIESEFSKIFT